MKDSFFFLILLFFVFFFFFFYTPSSKLTYSRALPSLSLCIDKYWLERILFLGLKKVSDRRIKLKIRHYDREIAFSALLCVHSAKTLEISILSGTMSELESGLSLRVVVRQSLLPTYEESFKTSHTISCLSLHGLPTRYKAQVRVDF